MKETKDQKGIALIVLIITIVVLLLLAVVAINFIINDREPNNSVIENEKTEVSDKNVYEGREGQKVKYDSNGDGEDEDWIILTDRNGLVEIVSASSIGSLTLGHNDPEIKENLLKYLDLNKDGIPDDLDGDGVIEEGGVDYNNDGSKTSDNDDIVIASYNNAISTINNYCKSLVKEELKDKVRSVGKTNNNFSAYIPTNYDNLETKITVDVASTDEGYKTDFERMVELGINSTEGVYWLASREVDEDEFSHDVNFYVRNVYYSGNLGGLCLWYLSSDGQMSVANNYTTCAVRLVITNPYGV